MQFLKNVEFNTAEKFYYKLNKDGNEEKETGKE